MKEKGGEREQVVRLEDLGVTREEATLSNGCKLIVFERPGMPIYMRATFLSGSRFDLPSKEGTSHFLEHMVVAGTENFPSKDKLAAHIEQFGGGFSASTGSDTMNINVAVGDPKDLKEMTRVLSEILLRPLFADGAIETERGSILKELGDRKSNPSEMVWEVHRRLFYQGTDVRSTLGSEESIKAVSRQDLKNFYEANMVSGRMVLVACGGVEVEEMRQCAEESLLLKRSSRVEMGAELPVIRDQKISVEQYLGKEQVNLIFGFRTPGALHPDKPTLDVIAEVLGGGRAASLTRKLRYERGLVYGVGAHSFGIFDAGTWVVKTSTSKDKVQEVVDVMSDEIGRVVDEGLTEVEIKFAKDKIVKSKRNEMQTSGSWVDFHSYRELVGEKEWTLSDYVSEIGAVDNESILRAARKYFGTDSWFLALCGDVREDFVKVELRSK